MYKRAQRLHPHPGQPADRENPQPQLGGGLQKLNNDTSPHVLRQWGEDTSNCVNNYVNCLLFPALHPVLGVEQQQLSAGKFSGQDRSARWVATRHWRCTVYIKVSLSILSCIVHNSPTPRYGQVARGHCPRSLHGPGGQAKFRANASSRWTVRWF